GPRADSAWAWRLPPPRTGATIAARASSATATCAQTGHDRNAVHARRGQPGRSPEGGPDGGGPGAVGKPAGGASSPGGGPDGGPGGRRGPDGGDGGGAEPDGG